MCNGSPKIVAGRREGAEEVLEAARVRHLAAERLSRTVVLICARGWTNEDALGSSTCRQASFVICQVLRCCEKHERSGTWSKYDAAQFFACLSNMGGVATAVIRQQNVDILIADELLAFFGELGSGRSTVVGCSQGSHDRSKECHYPSSQSTRQAELTC